MLSNLKKLLGYAWASPITIFGLAYAGLFQLLNWYKWYGVSDDALVWVLDLNSCPTFLLRLWRGWYGHTVGNVVVLRLLPDKKPAVLIHEKKHVDQMMRLGVFQPIIYSLCYLGIKFGCPGSNPYFTNSFEIDARRAAGQVIDVEGTLSKLNKLKKEPEIK